jgi:hypothetical protein
MVTYFYFSKIGMSFSAGSTEKVHLFSVDVNSRPPAVNADWPNAQDMRILTRLEWNQINQMEYAIPHLGGQ